MCKVACNPPSLHTRTHTHTHSAKTYLLSQGCLSLTLDLLHLLALRAAYKVQFLPGLGKVLSRRLELRVDGLQILFYFIELGLGRGDVLHVNAEVTPESVPNLRQLSVRDPA